MKYKLLKEIDTDSLPIGTEFETDNDYVNMDSGLKLPCKLLIDQGFIEEVKETPKPRWKVGDKVVFINYKTKYPSYENIQNVWYDDEDKCFMYNDWMEDKFRDPTPEELSTYFRFTYWYI